MSLSPEQDQIREIIKFYSDGMRTADVETLKKAFHQQANLYGYLGEELIAAPIQGLYDWVDASPAPEPYECTVLDIEITGRVASASIRETDPHGTVIDYFHLLKIGDQWSIVSKVWDAEPANS